MINVYKTNENKYVVEVNSEKLEECNLDDAVTIMSSLNVPFEEIESGLTSLIQNDDLRANYGINRSFIFSDKKKVS